MLKDKTRIGAVCTGFQFAAYRKLLNAGRVFDIRLKTDDCAPFLKRLSLITLAKNHEISFGDFVAFWNQQQISVGVYIGEVVGEGVIVMIYTKTGAPVKHLVKDYHVLTTVEVKLTLMQKVKLCWDSRWRAGRQVCRGLPEGVEVHSE
jgi:hypothetical protein